MNFSIIIPIKISDKVDKFIEYILHLTNELKPEEYQIVIADESNSEIYTYIDKFLKKDKNIVHFIPVKEVRTGDNDKLNGVYAALNYVKNDKILLVDDHYRISAETLRNVGKYFDKYDCFKTMPNFDKLPVSVLVDLCGMFVVNITDYRKQYCGHLAFRKSHILKAGFPDRDALFDELAIEERLRRYGYSIGFANDIALEATQDISAGKFFEQRIRYAYENIAIPFRFMFHLSILPILFLLGSINIELAFLIGAIMTLSVVVLAYIGQNIYGRFINNKFTFLFSIIWFWFYPFTTWIAVLKYFSGGVVFGGRKVKKAI